ncbi:MAG: 3'-5' exonuclease, partial [Thermodesulfobacteriota bacterium]
ESLVRHLDNHIEKVEQLVAEMLPRRDQWLRHVVDTRDLRQQRQALENALGAVITDTLAAAKDRLPADAAAELPELARFAAGNQFVHNPASPVCQCLGLHGLPDCQPESLSEWQGLAELLLTKEGRVRKNANKTIGFPTGPEKGQAGTKAHFQAQKAAFQGVLAALADDPGAAEALHAVRFLPAPYYTEAQWDMTEALFEILKLSAAHLQLVFYARNRVDFPEIGIRAKDALGFSDAPTDLALALDYRIGHILIDEFQDTSISQFELLARLTAGWTPGDGRTFFSVGDPMQSIYSFREAEVGLFLQAWDHGMGVHLPLTPLTLTANFRSDQGIVDWVNRAFANVLPENPDAATGAVPYTPFQAVRPLAHDPAVSVHPLIDADDDAVAGQVVDCVRSAQGRNPDDRVAILVRSRPHLHRIIARLRAAGVAFKAIEIDALGQRPVIRDLLSLTRAIAHPADRTAWLAVLRAPWCGLTLADLHAVAGDNHKQPIGDLINDTGQMARLSPDGQQRITRVADIMAHALANRRRRSLRRQTEGAWMALGGPACVHAAADLEDAAVYFDFLDEQIGNGALTDYPALEADTNALFARPDPAADDSLQVMTIHRAKGLEFETVILPGLEKTPPADRARLLLWLERADAPSAESLLLAPISEQGSADDPTYQYIRRLQAKKTDHEAARLLYVAATRAKKQLCIIGRGATDSAGRLRRPDRRSLLASLWPAVQSEFENVSAEEGGKAAGPVNGDGTEDPAVVMPYIRRLGSHWQAPAPPESVGVSHRVPAGQAIDDDTGGLPRFDWAGITVRRVGSVVHRWLRIICEDGADAWDAKRIEHSASAIYADLAAMGVDRQDRSTAMHEVTQALQTTLADSRGRWILATRTAGRCEYPLSGAINGEVRNVIIDRTFVDKDGIRWIIDYKSGTHTGGGLSAFLENEKRRYSTQMALYAQLMRLKDPDHPVRLALYFPRFAGWCHWTDDGAYSNDLTTEE